MVNVTDVAVFVNELCPYGGIRIYWDGDKGFGQYDLIVRSYYDEESPPDNYKLKITGDSEYMDTNEDKSFLKSLVESLVNHIEVIG